MNYQLISKLILGFSILAGVSTIFANSTFIQSTVGSGCSSVCIDNECTSNCGNSTVSGDSGSKKSASKHIELTGFDSLVVSGVNIELFQSDEYSVKLDTKESVFEKLVIVNQDAVLNISPLENISIDSELKVRVGLPSLKSLSRMGTGLITVRNFTQKSLHLDLSGTGKLIGKDNSIEALSIITSGTVDIEFTDSEVINALVTARGVNNIELKFTSPKSTLTGKLSGVSTVSYCGTPVNLVSALGISKTQKIECL